MTRPILEWIRKPSSRRGISFASRDGSWEFWSYARLADLSSRFAQGLTRAGLQQLDTVALIQTSSPGFVASLFGAIMAGGIPAPMPPPEQFLFTDDYQQRIRELLRVAAPRFVLLGADAPATLRNLFSWTNETKVIAVDTLLHGEYCQFRDDSADLALLQFTSGSSGHCRAVRVPHSALEVNIEAIHRWLEWKHTDVAASWLPLHHDMGLIGCLLSALVRESDLWLFEPEHFVRSPLRYLRCLGEKGVSLTALPNFALDHIVRRVRPDLLDGTDFSALRGVIVGSEMLKADSFAGFNTLLAPFGFERHSLLPAYGLAEATLAATGVPLREGWSQLVVDRKAIAWGANVAQSCSDLSAGSTLVGCGRPLAGVSITIENESNQTLTDNQIGQIVVRGNSVAAGYLKGVSAGETHFRAEGLQTGDMGFIHDGQLFVLGRLGDSLKIRGRSLFAQDVESALSTLGLPPRRVVALLGSHEGEPTAVVLLERPAANHISGAHSLLRSLASGAKAVVLEVPRGSIRRTSSGKVRRRELWEKFCTGGFAELHCSHVG